VRQTPLFSYTHNRCWNHLLGVIRMLRMKRKGYLIFGLWSITRLKCSKRRSRRQRTGKRPRSRSGRNRPLQQCMFYYCRTYYKAVRVGGGWDPWGIRYFNTGCACFPWFLSFGNRTQNSRVAGARPNHQAAWCQLLAHTCISFHTQKWTKNNYAFYSAKLHKHKTRSRQYFKRLHTMCMVCHKRKWTVSWYYSQLIACFCMDSARPT